MSERQRREDIQGLRGIAVLSVVLYHASAGSVLHGGFQGVDIFFVLSGFLITSIIVNELRRGSYTVAGFYKRRVRRLLPALSLVLLAVLLAGLFTVSPPTYAKIAQSVAATLLFSSNMYFMFGSGYFEEASHLKPLLHTWSLSVEEQFYLVYPLALALAYRLRKGALAALIFGGIFASIALQFALLKYNHSEAFFLAPARAYELLIGAAIVICRPASEIISARMRGTIAALALIGIGASLIIIRSSNSFPGLPALAIATLTAITLWCQAPLQSAAGRILCFRPLTWFGDLSYSLYLWHWPLLVYARHWSLGEISPSLAAALMIAATILAYLSYRFVEQPFTQNLKNIPVFRYAAVAMGLLIATSAVIAVTHGVDARLGAKSRSLLNARNDYHPNRVRCHADGDAMLTAETACIFGDRRHQPDIAVWGDSHAAELSYQLGLAAGESSHSLIQFSASACPPALKYISERRPNCSDRNDEILKILSSMEGIKTVYLVMNYSGYPKHEQDNILAGYEKSIRELIKSGKHVISIGPIPTMPYDAPSALQLLNDRDGDFRNWGIGRDEFNLVNRPYTHLLSRLKSDQSVEVVDSAKMLCDENKCRAYRDGFGVLYFNADHLSLAGARILARQAIQEANLTAAQTGTAYKDKDMVSQ